MPTKKRKYKKAFDFLGFYEEIRKLQIDLRAEICQACDWSNATFYRKFKQPRSYSKIEKIAIAQICNDLTEKVVNKIPRP